jgi:hypothetical protein
VSKYEPIEAFLRALKVSRYRADFQHLEKLLGFPLPRSAFQYPAWWSNDATGHSHARAWLEAGWRTEEVDVQGRKVTFKRVAAEQAGPPPAKRDPWGCMAGTVTVLPGTEVTAPAGEAWSAEAGSLLSE